MRVSDLILRNIAKRCVSKDDATELESALEALCNCERPATHVYRSFILLN